MIYSTVTGDTFDLIAFKVYGQSKMAKAIMDANPDYLDALIFSSNVQLHIPDVEVIEPSSLPPWKSGDSE